MTDASDDFLELVSRPEDDRIFCLVLTSGRSGLSAAILECVASYLIDIAAMSGDDCLVLTLRNNHGLILPSRRSAAGSRAVSSLESLRGVGSSDADVYALCERLGVPFGALPALILVEACGDQMMSVPIEPLLIESERSPTPDDVLAMFRWFFEELRAAMTREPGKRLREIEKAVAKRAKGRATTVTNGLLSEIVRGFVNAAGDQLLR